MRSILNSITRRHGLASSATSSISPLIGSSLSSSLSSVSPLMGGVLGAARSNVSAKSGLNSFAGGQRYHTVFMQRAAIGRRLDIRYGRSNQVHHGASMPPKHPRHPTKDQDKPMLDMQTYADLKVRWRLTTKPTRRRIHIARKWHCKPNHWPKPAPSSMFVMHKNMPHTHRLPVEPPNYLIEKGGLDTSNAFAVFKTSIEAQHKVAVGDLIQAEKIHRRDAGEKVVYGTVLLVGSRNWTIIGKPTVPYARVHCTIEQQTLTGEKISFKYKSKRRASKFNRSRQWVSMLRVDKIEVDPSFEPNPEPPKAERVLDLWANRWLRPEERELIQRNEDGTPLVSQFYDGKEHQPGTYHRRGLCEDYRFYPDPYTNEHEQWIKQWRGRANYSG